MPAAVAIKVSSDLAEAARAEAEHADRSLTGQIEHWAKLGRVLESKIPVPVINALKRSKGDLDQIDDPVLKKQVTAAIEAFQRLAPEEKRSAIGLDQMIRLEPDPGIPGGVIQVTPDGHRTPGTLKGRTFIPAES